MEKDVFKKFEELKKHISAFKRAGVAFSGGIDSSLLLYAAAKTLHSDDVIALHGRSSLSCDESGFILLYEDFFKPLVKLEIIDLHPLSWPEFINNDSKRCYYCKKKTYVSFFDFLGSRDIETLLDGTNRDDLDESRAGLAVLRELGVKTPLADVGLRKKEIRFLAKIFGLPNYATPSNSCLATRLNFMQEITAEGLENVKKIEVQLNELGFFGCRAKPFKDGLVIELSNQDFLKMSSKHKRLTIIEKCRKHGFEQVYINLKGR